MADIQVPSIATATPAAADTVAGVQGGAVKRFAVSNLAKVGSFTQAGTGAEARTVESKLRDVVSVKDFGATGDGVTDDTAAIQSALTYCVANGKDLFSPAGNYLYSPSETMVLDLITAAKGGLRLFGEGNASRWYIDADGVIFDVKSCAIDASGSPLFVENMWFELQNPSTNTNATLFHIERQTGGATEWACRFHIDGCSFWRWTNTAVKALMAFNSTIKNSYFHGANTDVANGGAGTFAAYNDAGVRLWGGAGDGSGTPSFSNLCEIDTCTFRLSRYGVEFYSALWCKVRNCTFDPVWVGVAAKPNDASNHYGTNVSLIEMTGNWFEEQTSLGYTTKWYYVDKDINFDTGADIAGTNSVIQSAGENYYNSGSYVKRNVYPYIRTGSVYSQKYGGAENQSLLTYQPSYLFFKGQHFSPSETYYEFKANQAYVAPNVTVGNPSQRNVGAPGSLDIKSKLQVEALDGSASISVVRCDESATPSYITLAKARGASLGSVTPVQNNDALGRIDFVGADGNDLYSRGAAIAAVVNGTPANNFMPADLRFYTTSSGDSPAERVRIEPEGHTRPGSDNAQTLGSASFKWSVVYAGTGTINTSDEREKQQIGELSAAEMRVAAAIKRCIRRFKFNDAVAAKGGAARIHVGVIAQDVAAAFEAEGLDPHGYALFCSDAWTDMEGVERTRLGVRYEELLAFVIAAM